jgi:phage/plasmid-like protein (TIGR03299 family)
MAHLVETMAFWTNPLAWTRQKLTPNQPLEVWAQQAGMDWRIESSDVSYMAQNDRGQSIIMPFEEQRVLSFRYPCTLSVVSQRFQEVQPMEILHFYKDLTEQSGFELETAGVLKGGKKFWALARTGQSSALKGKMSVMAIFYWQPPVMAHWQPQHNSPVFVWCVTTLWQLPYVDSNNAGVVKVPHSTDLMRKSQTATRYFSSCMG